MMRAKCKNCEKSIRPQGNMLCSYHRKPTNADGCCYNYEPKMFVEVGGFTLIIVLAVTIIVGAGVLVCNG